ncbi:conserved hypothetical protein [Histoplasma capsulatum H143]|uniref:Uncharacterized protein n=1 Tax=Ajellomyces capsulatus (strain H143) TaxID=544712 RepID=C6HCJ6_AJECH|nr:conserved hypothetical protein [Histoplasma capsulatum H143]
MAKGRTCQRGQMAANYLCSTNTQYAIFAKSISRGTQYLWILAKCLFESFFYVLIWQCARHGWEKLNELQRQGLDQPKDSMLREWYTGTYKKIAIYK